MDHDTRNPCDLCKRKKCFDVDDDSGFECAFHGYTSKYHCSELQCFLNYEGTCMVNLYDRCGAWED